MMSQPLKSITQREVCASCSKQIYLGQSITECKTCNYVIHTKCFSSSLLANIRKQWHCYDCINSSDLQRYNPYFEYNKITTDEDEEKFYNAEPSDHLDSLLDLNNLLESCSSHSVADLNKLVTDNKFNSHNNFSSYFLNIDGNKSNFDHLASELGSISHKFSVIGIAETNVEEAHKDLYKLDGYEA